MSERLNEHFENNTDVAKTLEHLEKLRWMDIDPAILEHFENRVLWILEKNPEAGDIVNNTLEKTNLSIEITKQSYASAFWDIINNPGYEESNEDENYVA